MSKLEEIERDPNVKYFRLQYDVEHIHMVIGDDIMASTNSSLNVPLIDRELLQENKKYPKGVYVKMEECGGFCSWCIGTKCKYFGHIETSSDNYVKIKYCLFEE